MNETLIGTVLVIASLAVILGLTLLGRRTIDQIDVKNLKSVREILRGIKNGG